MKKDSTVYELIKVYVDVGTASIAHHRKLFPFKQIFDAIDHHKPLTKARVFIKDQGMSPWQVVYQGGKLLMEEAEKETGTIWVVPQSHLELVELEKQTVIENLTLLDLGWLVDGTYN